jgi:hypothetical protein
MVSTLRKELGLKGFENGVRKVFGPKTEDVRETEEQCIMRDFIDYNT